MKALPLTLNLKHTIKMETTIIFGSKRLGQQLASHSSGDKYSDRAVVTVEGYKGAGKSRRLLFNTKAAGLLNLDNGEVQELVFASVEGKNRQVLVANKSLVPEADQENVVSYKTSKNKVSNGEDTKEKSKAITSSFFTKEVFAFLGIDELSGNAEFYLNTFNGSQIEAHALVPVGQEPVIETNHGSHTMSDVQESVTTEIARQEAADNILEEDYNEEVESIEVVEEEVVEEVETITPQVSSGSDFDIDETDNEEEVVEAVSEESEWD